MRTSSRHIRLTCQRARIAFPAKEMKRLQGTLKAYFNCVIGQNFESLDRRFLLTKDHQVQFQGLSKEHSMPLEKLAASLSLPRTALFSYLKIANRKKRTLISYSKSERIIIKQFVRLSNYKKSYIPCTAMRNVCR